MQLQGFSNWELLLHFAHRYPSTSITLAGAFLIFSALSFHFILSQLLGPGVQKSNFSLSPLQKHPVHSDDLINPWGIQLQSLVLFLMQGSTVPERFVFFIFTRLKTVSVKQHITVCQYYYMAACERCWQQHSSEALWASHRRWLCFHLLVLIEAMSWHHQRENYARNYF